MTDAVPAFRRKKRLTKPALKLILETPVFVLIVSKIHEGTQRGKAQLDSDGKPKKPPMICDIIDMTTGEDCALICSEVVRTELAESYPDDSYVGKGFEITKQKRKEGKRYDPYDISEIEVPDKYADVVAKVVKPAESDVTPAKTAARGR